MHAKPHHAVLTAMAKLSGPHKNTALHTGSYL